MSSNTVRLLAILSLLLIVAGVFILMNLGGERSGSGGSSSQSGDESFITTGSRAVTASVDPCGLISVDEISNALDLRLKDAESGFVGNPLGERYCRIPHPQTRNTDVFFLSVIFNGEIDPVVRENNFDVVKWYESRKASPELIQTVEDLGSEAFWGGSGHELWNGLHILAYDVYLHVNVDSGAEDTDYRVARMISVTVMEKLFKP